MAEYGKFFKTYFILVIFSAILWLSETIYFAFTEASVHDVPWIWSILGSLFSFAMFVLSIVALILFIRNKFAKITFVIPIFLIVVLVIVFVWGFIKGIVAAIQGIPADQIVILTPAYIIFIILASLFKLSFSIYSLLKFK